MRHLRFLALLPALLPLGLSLCAVAALAAGPQGSDSGADTGSGSQLVMTPLQMETPAWTPPSYQHLFGDLGGVRSYLESRGIYLNLDATAEFAGNVSGGLKQGSTSANQVGFSADVDWQQLAGLTGFSTHLIVVNRSGGNDSHLFGDNVSPVQEIYGAGGGVAVHLVSAFAEEALFSQRLDIAGGWMNVENDFASSPLYCNFMNNVLCGDPKALPGGDIGHSAFPDAAWAGRIRARPTPDFLVTFGVYEVNQDLYSNADRSGFEFGVPRDSGVYAPIQLTYSPNIGPDQLPGHYVVGVGYDSSRFKSFDSVLPGTPLQNRHGNTQFWALVDQMVVRNGPGDQSGVILLGGVIVNNADNSSYAQQYTGALLDSGFLRARPDDFVGLMFSYIAISGVLGKVQAEEEALGLPISNSATGVQTHEMILEADYNIHVYRGLDFRPDFQYVVRPNAQADIHNAVVFGFKAHVQF